MSTPIHWQKRHTSDGFSGAARFFGRPCVPDGKPTGSRRRVFLLNVWRATRSGGWVLSIWGTDYGWAPINNTPGLTFGEAIAHGNAIMRLGMKAKDFGVE